MLRAHKYLGFWSPRTGLMLGSVASVWLCCLLATPVYAATCEEVLGSLDENANMSFVYGVKPGEEIRTQTLRMAFRQKYPMRNLFSGGPLPVIAPYGHLAPDQGIIEIGRLRRSEVIAQNKQDLVDRYGVEHASHYTFDPYQMFMVDSQFIHEGHVLEPRALAMAMVEGRISGSFVYKRNLSALGVGMLFLELSDEAIVVRVPVHNSGEYPLEDNPIVPLELLGAYAWDYSEPFAEEAFFLRVQRDDPAAVFYLELLFEGMFVDLGCGAESAIVEGKIDAIKINGRNYETRHLVDGNVATGEVRLVKENKACNAAWMARIGSLGNYVRLSIHDMYNPLFVAFKIPPEAQAGFKAYVDELLIQQWQFMLQKLRASGIQENMDVYGAVDLLWLPPRTAGEYPRPMILETDLNLFFQEGRPEKIIIRP